MRVWSPPMIYLPHYATLLTVHYFFQGLSVALPRHNAPEPHSLISATL